MTTTKLRSIVIIASWILGCVPIAGSPPIPNPQSAIPNSQSVWHRLLAEDARPHVLCVYTRENLEWLLDAEHLQELRDLSFGPVVFFANLYTGQEPNRRGHVPIDGRYEYTDADLVAKAQAAVRFAGCKVIGYMHGPAWRSAGLTPFDALEEIKRHGWDGVYGDNFQIGSNVWETYDFMVRLKRLGLIIFHHAAVEPHYGRVAWRGPWARLEDYVRWGETNNPPADLTDPAWYYRISQISRSDAIGLYSWKNAEQWCEHPEQWKPTQAALGCTVLATPCPTVWKSFKEDYYPAWLNLAERYRRDPNAFLADPPTWQGGAP